MTKKTIPYYGAEPADSITSYKPFIDGLRALAVVSVVFFHVGLNAVRGGFVGVDIFFVISGFLIINTIREGLHDGGFSFGDFWSRRALRILPPYLLVIVASALVAPFVLVLPVEYTQFAQEVGTSSVFLINHLFLVQQGYFDLNSDLKVLLHLWSLAVEEQFYIVAPLLLWVLWKLPAKISGAIVAAIFAVSLLGCIAYTTGGQNLAFYVMPFRAWEFVAGGAIGLFVVAAKRLPKIVLELIAIAGVAAIICAVTLFSKKTPFPSYYAALPVFGCSAIILAGLANARIIVARILALPPFVAVGLISYSWYLWHWPLLTLARIHDFGSYNLNRDYVLAAVSFALATGTYLFIERPIRLNRKRFLISSWRPAIIGLLVCCVLGVAGWRGFQTHADRVEASIPPQMLRTKTLSLGDCDLGRAQSAKECLERANGSKIGILVGDSHAGAATMGVNEAAAENGTVLTGAIYGGCPALFDVRILNPDKAMNNICEMLRANALRLLPDIHLDYAILISRWEIYGTEKTDYGLGASGTATRAADQSATYETALRKTIETLSSVGAKRVLIMAPLPSFNLFTPDCILRSDYYGIDRAKYCSKPRAKVDAERQVALKRLAEATRDFPYVRIFDPIELFCDDKVCRSYVDHAALFNDSNHPSDTAIRMIYRAFKSDFVWAIAGKNSPAVENNLTR